MPCEQFLNSLILFFSNGGGELEKSPTSDCFESSYTVWLGHDNQI